MPKSRPDLVLQGIMMSYAQDGLDVLREMREGQALKGVPVIMVTSLTSVRDAEALPGGEQIPANARLNKPVDPETLLAKADAALS